MRKNDAISLHLTTEGQPFFPLLKDGGLLLSHSVQRGSRRGQRGGDAML